MFRDRRKPWNRTASVRSTRWSSFAINPDPTPTPDPQPPDDDDDDDLQVWVGASGKYENAAKTLFVHALGDAGCGATGDCFSGIFVETERYDDPYTETVSDSGSIPPRIGRQAARTFIDTAGGGRFQVFMAAPDWETAAGASNDACYHHLYFAWLDDQQYNAISGDAQAYPTYPVFDETDHKMMRFDGEPYFSVNQPFVESWGKIRTKVSSKVEWIEVRVSMFGIVGDCSLDTPLAWCWSQPAKEDGEIWHFGKNHTTPFVGTGADGKDAVEVFVVGWGLYKKQGQIHAAVTPPLCTGRSCYRPGIGEFERDPKTALKPGVHTPAGWRAARDRDDGPKP